MTRTEFDHQDNPKLLKAITHEVRRDIFQTILNVDNGHLGGNSSSTELLVALYFGGFLRFDPSDTQNPNRDRVLIRGHEGPLRYKIFSMLGCFDEKELENYREYGSMLKGHEDMDTTPGVDITPSGSLGMLLSYGVGSSIVAKNNGQDYRTFVFLGDGEEQEGNVSEAARHAANLGLDNLICIIDQNKKQLSRPTVETDGATDLKKVWEGYGWEVRVIEDGNNIDEVIGAYQLVNHITKPTVFIAKTEKSKGLEGNLESANGYHTLTSCKPSIVADGIINQQNLLDQSGFTEEIIDTEIRKIYQNSTAKVSVAENKFQQKFPVKLPIEPLCSNNLDKAQDKFLDQLHQVLETTPDAPSVYILNADFLWDKTVKSLKLNEISHFYDVGIREQHLISMAHGISTTDPNARIIIPYGDTFLYRAADQINAASQGHSKFLISSRMSGLSMDRNGKTHQSSGQPGLIATMPGVDFFEPADVRDLYNVFNWFMSENPGLVYVRSHRVNVELLERQTSDLENIKYYITFDSDKKPDLVLVGSGFVVSEAVKAAKKMYQEDGLSVRVINVVNPKKLDQGFVEMTENDRPIMTIYNGNPLILQNPVTTAVMENSSFRPSVIKSHGFEYGDTGRLKDLMRHYRLDSDGIIQTVKEKLIIK